MATEPEGPPLLSVIVPLYNEERYLAEMLSSLVGQTVADWEAILVDDGSTDGTVSIMSEWAARDPRIRIASIGEKLGKVQAFNLAFQESAGAYVCHVGGDDRLPPESLDTRLSALRDAPARSVLLGKLQMIDSEGRDLGSPVPRGARGSQSSPGATYTRALCEQIFPIPQCLPSEDIWLGNAAVGCADNVLHTTTPVIDYRIHPGNSNPRSKTFEEMNESIHARSRAIELLLSSPSMPLSADSRAILQARWEAEMLRYEGRTVAVLAAEGIGVIDRVAMASMSHRTLWKIRQRLGSRASGWRGR